MPTPAEAYLAMMGGGAAPAAAPPAMPPTAPVAQPEEAIPDDLLEEIQHDKDPTTQEGQIIFMDPDQMPGDVRKGQRVEIRGRVQSIGSKIGLTTDSVSYISSDEDTEEPEDEDDDY